MRILRLLAQRLQPLLYPEGSVVKKTSLGKIGKDVYKVSTPQEVVSAGRRIFGRRMLNPHSKPLPKK